MVARWHDIVVSGLSVDDVAIVGLLVGSVFAGLWFGLGVTLGKELLGVEMLGVVMPEIGTITGIVKTAVTVIHTGIGIIPVYLCPLMLC